MYSGYMWLSRGGVYGTYVVRWDQPRSTVANNSLHYVRTPAGSLQEATAWIRSVTVRDPGTGQETDKPSSDTAAVRIEDNAVAVTFGLNSSFDTECQGLVNV